MVLLWPCSALKLDLYMYVSMNKSLYIQKCVKSVRLVFQRLGWPIGLKPPKAFLKLPGPLDPGGALARNGGGLRVRAQGSVTTVPTGGIP